MFKPAPPSAMTILSFVRLRETSERYDALAGFSVRCEVYVDLGRWIEASVRWTIRLEGDRDWKSAMSSSHRVVRPDEGKPETMTSAIADDCERVRGYFDDLAGLFVSPPLGRSGEIFLRVACACIRASS